MSDTHSPIEVYCLCAPEDYGLLRDLVTFLNPLQHKAFISLWHEGMITAGDNRLDVSLAHLNQAAIILFLVSSNFLDATPDTDMLIRRALERHNAGDVLVVPILLRPSIWTYSHFAQLSPLPDNKKPITEWSNREKAFSNIANGLLKIVHHLRAESTPPISQQQANVRTQTPDLPDNHSSIDVCIVCALAAEAQAFLRQAERQCNVSWTRKVNARHGYTYLLATIQNAKGEALQVHVSWLSRYGPQQMVSHLHLVLEEHQPRLAAMTGICAGDKHHTKLGDLIVADRTFTYDSGKFIKDSSAQPLHLHDTITYQVHENILGFIQFFDQWNNPIAALQRPVSKRQQRDWLLDLLFKGTVPSLKALPQQELKKCAPAWRDLVHELQQEPEPFLLESLALRDSTMVERLSFGRDPFPFLDPTQPRLHVRPMASGNAVRSDNPFKEIQGPVRGAIAIDMEGAAFGLVLQRFPTIHWFIVKGVSDYADQDKDDSYHTYAEEASASYALSLIQEYVTQERLPARQKR